ncbi:hypothetical protein [Brasilonema bromeliae]|uniref:hypothetical protein n=1 Tax=Brasilonema bromeliae TaxID=383615 RepID=UPI00145FB532
MTLTGSPVTYGGKPSPKLPQRGEPDASRLNGGNLRTALAPQGTSLCSAGSLMTSYCFIL